jgi:uncharacterized membrane protein HdeD (DUF308 family)
MIVLVVESPRAFALRGAAALLFGLVTLVWPGLTLTALVLLFGAFVLVNGAAKLIDGFRAPAGERNPLLLTGSLDVSIGLITFLWPDITALALLYLIAAWALLTGILQIVAAIRLRRELRREWLLGLSGGLSVLFAVLLVITPGAGALVITWLIGWFALFYGALLLAIAWRLRKLDAAPPPPSPVEPEVETPSEQAREGFR